MTGVSVVVPTRDRRKLLSETVQSIVDQECADWELIIVDDASTDDTARYLDTLTDPRMRWTIHDAVQGVAAARNTGLGLATHELVMFVDDDDLLRPTAIAHLRDALIRHPDALAVSGACRLFHENGDSCRVYRAATPSLRSIWRELLFGWWSNSGQNMYRTAVVRAIGGFDVGLRVAEDRELWLQIARRGSVALVPMITMEYRQHSGQTTKRPDIEVERQKIWRRFIASLPPRRQREGRRIRRAATWSARSESRRSGGQFIAAIGWQLAAIMVAPRLLFSPLTGRPLYWNLKKSLLRRAVP